MATQTEPVQLFTDPNRSVDDLSGRTHRRYIGYMGAALPPLVWLTNALLPTDGLPRFDTLSSISAYYYTSAVAFFVGILFALAVFFFTYRGYANKNERDRRAAKVAAWSALLVAFFPTSAASDIVPSWWNGWYGKLHLLSAGVLFGSFIYFSLILFRSGSEQDPKASEAEKQDRRWRNRLYFVCGLGMLACIAWIALEALLFENHIFWPESIALELFALSWMVKGRADETVLGMDPVPTN